MALVLGLEENPLSGYLNNTYTNKKTYPDR